MPVVGLSWAYAMTRGKNTLVLDLGNQGAHSTLLVMFNGAPNPIAFLGLQNGSFSPESGTHLDLFLLSACAFMNGDRSTFPAHLMG